MPEVHSVEYWQGAIDTEYDKILEKLPWYEVAIITIGSGLAVLAVSVACAPSGPGIALCIAAIVALLLAALKYILAYKSTGDEAAELEVKANALEEAASQLE